MAGFGVSFLLLVPSSFLGLYLFYGFAHINPNIDQQDTLVWVYAKRSYVRGLVSSLHSLTLLHFSCASRPSQGSFLVWGTG
jgi:hypothetical protein